MIEDKSAHYEALGIDAIQSSQYLDELEAEVFKPNISRKYKLDDGARSGSLIIRGCDSIQLHINRLNLGRKHNLHNLTR